MEQAEQTPDFALNIYKGCVLPEDYRPIRTTTWNKYIAEHQGEYTEYQFELIRRRLIDGKSWVTFAKVLETLSAPEHYKPLPMTAGNSIWHREKLV